MSTIFIIEREKAIIEAKGVTKLTEARLIHQNEYKEFQGS
jgi:hypothetical protein